MRFRTLCGASMIGGVALLIYVDAGLLGGRVLGSLLMTALAAAGWLEYARITGISGRGPKSHLGLHATGLAAIVYFFGLAWLAGREGFSPEAPWIIGGIASLVAVAFVLVVAMGDFENHYVALLETVAGSLLLGFMLSYLVRIYRLPGLEGPVLWGVLMAGVKGNDMAAYYVGKTWGRRRFLKVSPNKTLEGCLGALAFSVAYFGGAAAVLGSALPGSLFHWPSGMLFGMIVSLASQAGDLAESLIKRMYQVKDSGALVPEFGGVLDMIDSLVFSGILFWGLR